MKKLRVYYLCSLLAETLFFEVETPAEGKLLIDSLETTVGKIINENGLQTGRPYAIGLQVEDNTDESGWVDWYSPNGDDVFNYTHEELRAIGA